VSRSSVNTTVGDVHVHLPPGTSTARAFLRAITNNTTSTSAPFARQAHTILLRGIRRGSLRPLA
jgi:hypothetical protein